MEAPSPHMAGYPIQTSGRPLLVFTIISYAQLNVFSKVHLTSGWWVVSGACTLPPSCYGVNPDAQLRPTVWGTIHKSNAIFSTPPSCSDYSCHRLIVLFCKKAAETTKLLLASAESGLWDHQWKIIFTEVFYWSEVLYISGSQNRFGLVRIP